VLMEINVMCQAGRQKPLSSGKLEKEGGGGGGRNGRTKKNAREQESGFSPL